MVGQVLDQVAEVDASLGGEVEDDLGAVEGVFGAHQLHLHVAGLHAFLAVAHGLLLAGGVGGGLGDIVVGGDAQHRLQPVRGLFFGDVRGAR